MAKPMTQKLFWELMTKDQYVEMPYLDTTSHRGIAAIMSSVLLSRPVMVQNTKT